MEKSKSYVQDIRLVNEIDKRVALASIQVGDVLIRGVAVWRSAHGKLRVYFPSFKAGYGFEDAVSVPVEVRSEIEADVISAYREAKASRPETEGGR